MTYQHTAGDHSFGTTGIPATCLTAVTPASCRVKASCCQNSCITLCRTTPARIAIRSAYQSSKLISFTGRINYAYKGRYLLSLTGRSDGSSKLAPGNQWAFFPSVAGAWRISDEKFMHSQRVFSDLKLRASWGIAGNDAIRPYSTQTYMSKIPFSFDDTNAALAYWHQRPDWPTSNSRWELSATTDIVIDIGLFDGRISAAIDYYDTHTKDLLLQRTLPSSSGVSTVVQNIGKTRNRGIEVGINTTNVSTKDFSWTSGIVFSRNKEIVSLADENTNDAGQQVVHRFL